jgi:hypothetical protein
LSKGDVKEAVIGVSAQVEIDDALFQMAFSTINLSDLVENLNRMRQAFAQLENFVSTQLLLKTSQHQVSTYKALDDNNNLKIELVSIWMKDIKRLLTSHSHLVILHHIADIN